MSDRLLDTPTASVATGVTGSEEDQDGDQGSSPVDLAVADRRGEAAGRDSAITAVSFDVPAAEAGVDPKSLSSSGSGDDFRAGDFGGDPDFTPVHKSNTRAALTNMELRELDHSFGSESGAESGRQTGQAPVAPPRRESNFSKVTAVSEMSGNSGTATGTANSSRSAGGLSLLGRFRHQFSKAEVKAPESKSATLTSTIGSGGNQTSRNGSKKTILVPKKKGRSTSQMMGGFDGPFNEDFLIKVQEKKDLEGLLPKQALREARLDRIMGETGTLEAALLTILERSETQGEACQLMDAVFSRGVDLGTRDEPYLHKAAERNFVYAARMLIDNEVNMDVADETDRLPVVIALQANHDEMASVIMRRTPKKSIKELFEISKDGDTNHHFNFQDMVIAGIMPLSCRAVLDACLSPTDEPDEYRFYYRILESDPTGLAPSDSGFNIEGKTGFHRVLECKDREMQRHNVVRMLIYNKWVEYGERMALINLMLYLTFMLFVTFSLVSAGRQADPRVYNSNEDYARAVLEIVSLLALCFNLYDEFKEFTREKLDYFKDGNNYIQLGSIFLLFALIPLRWTNVDAQWHVAAFAYVFMCMRILQLISVTRVVGIYLQILTRILYKDITRFVIIFGIFLLTYSGSLFFALRGARVPVADPGTNMTASTDPKVTTELSINHFTSNYGFIVLSGLRTMIEQESSVDYLNDAPVSDSFSWLGVVINMLFLFFVLVVLLNILIAQLSDTYADVKADAQRELEQNWATSLRNFEQGTSPLRRYRFHNYDDYEDVTNPGQRIIGWEEPTNVDEDEEEKRRQRQMASDIEKQGQQMMALKSQMRTALELLYENKKVPPHLDEKILELGSVQVPEVVNNIIGRTESTLRSDVAQSQEQQRDHYANLSTAAQGHAETITQSLHERVTSTQELVNQHHEATARRIDSVKDSLAEAIPQHVSDVVHSMHNMTLKTLQEHIHATQEQVQAARTTVQQAEAAILAASAATSATAQEQRVDQQQDMRKAVDASEKRIISMLARAVSEQSAQLRTELLERSAQVQRDVNEQSAKLQRDVMDRSAELQRQVAQTTTELRRDVTQLEGQLNSRHDSLVAKLQEQTDNIMDRLPQQ